MPKMHRRCHQVEMTTHAKTLTVLRNIAFGVLLCIVSVGCMTTNQYSTTSAQTLFEPGDKVTITKSDGQVVEFKVEEVNEQGISGDGKYVAYTDMREVLITELDSEKTTEVVVTAAGAIAVGYLLLRELAKGLSNYPAIDR